MTQLAKALLKPLTNPFPCTSFRIRDMPAAPAASSCPASKGFLFPIHEDSKVPNQSHHKKSPDRPCHASVRSGLPVSCIRRSAKGPDCVRQARGKTLTGLWRGGPRRDSSSGGQFVLFSLLFSLFPERKTLCFPQVSLTFWENLPGPCYGIMSARLSFYEISGTPLGADCQGTEIIRIYRFLLPFRLSLRRIPARIFRVQPS